MPYRNEVFGELVDVLDTAIGSHYGGRLSALKILDAGARLRPRADDRTARVSADAVIARAMQTLR